MSQGSSLDVVTIKEWIAKEPHLPQDFDDFIIQKFLHSCYGSLERTKKCIDRFCTTRTVMTEVYTRRDPLSTKMKTAFSIASVASYKADNQEIIVHQLDDPGLEKFVFYDVIKAFTMQTDCWIQSHQFFAEGHIFVLDIKDYTLRIVPKVNIMFFRDFLIYLLEGIPVRVKQIHVVNTPSYYEKLYALVKPVLPTDICNIIHFHPSHLGLHKMIDKKFLPVEYGGDASSLKDQHLDWVKKIEDDRNTFLNDKMWKADLKKKPKSFENNTMSGSFKTLSID